MWRNYALEIPHRAVESFLVVFRTVYVRSFRFSCSQREARNRVPYTYERQFSMLAQRKSFRKRDEVAFTPCPTHFSASSLRFSKMSYQSVSDFIFRFTLAIRRCTTTRSFGCFCQLALAQYRPFRSFIRENYAFRVYLSRVTASFYPLFLLHSNSQFFCIGYYVQMHRFCAFGNKKLRFINFVYYL